MLDRERFWQLTQRITNIISTVIILSVAYYAVQLLFVGQKIVGVTEGSPGSQVSQLPHQVYFAPYPLAYGYLPAILLFLFGLWVRKWSLMIWIGWVWLVVWSSALLFSSGAVLIPVLGILLVCMIILHISTSSIAASAIASKRGSF